MPYRSLHNSLPFLINMDKNTEKFNELAAIADEDELNEMLDENIAGAGSSLQCIQTTLGNILVSKVFNCCPTYACTPPCRK